MNDMHWCQEYELPKTVLQKHARVDGARGLFNTYIDFIEWCARTGHYKGFSRDDWW